MFRDLAAPLIVHGVIRHTDWRSVTVAELRALHAALEAKWQAG